MFIDDGETGHQLSVDHVAIAVRAALVAKGGLVHVSRVQLLVERIALLRQTMKLDDERESGKAWHSDHTSYVARWRALAGG